MAWSFLINIIYVLLSNLAAAPHNESNMFLRDLRFDLKLKMIRIEIENLVEEKSIFKQSLILKYYSVFLCTLCSS